MEYIFCNIVIIKDDYVPTPQGSNIPSLKIVIFFGLMTSQAKLAIWVNKIHAAKSSNMDKVSSSRVFEEQIA